MEYDFLGSAYINTTYEELFRALTSIKKQTLRPNKVVLVIDGPIKFNLDKILLQFDNKLKIQIINLKKNSGLGVALRKGLEVCVSKYVLRFDTDDINLPIRAARQIQFMEQGQYDISSTSIFEFIGNPDNIIAVKKLPINNFKIKMYTNNGKNIFDLCTNLLNTIRGKYGIFQVQVTAINLRLCHIQKDIFENDNIQYILDRTIDEINKKFGKLTIIPARLNIPQENPDVISPSWRPSGHRKSL